MSGNFPYPAHVPIGETADGKPVFASRSFIDFLLVQIFNYLGGTTGTIPVTSLGGDGLTMTTFLASSGVYRVPDYPVGANPSGTAGLTAVNGSAATFLRSDGAPAVSQAIVPTWTGVHAFTAGLTTTTMAASGAATAQSLATTAAATVGTGFGCNGKTAQTAAAVGAAVAGTAATNITPYGYTTQAQADDLVARVNTIRAALVANGVLV